MDMLALIRQAPEANLREALERILSVTEFFDGYDVPGRAILDRMESGLSALAEED